MSLSLDLRPLRQGRETRSGVAPSWFRKKMGGASALCAPQRESHKHAWALRHLGQELGHDCGACENLLTVLDMISTCERRADLLNHAILKRHCELLDTD